MNPNELTGPPTVNALKPLPDDSILIFPDKEANEHCSSKTDGILRARCEDAIKYFHGNSDVRKSGREFLNFSFSHGKGEFFLSNETAEMVETGQVCGFEHFCLIK